MSGLGRLVTCLDPMAPRGGCRRNGPDWYWAGPICWTCEGIWDPPPVPAPEPAVAVQRAMQWMRIYSGGGHPEKRVTTILSLV